MEQFDQYSVEELVLNEAFRSRVLHPTAEQELEFRRWIENHPEESQKYVAAADLVRSVRITNSPLSASDHSRAVQQIFELTTRKVPAVNSRPLYHWAFAVAAVLAVIIGFYILPAKNQVGSSSQQLAQIADREWEWNKTSRTKLIQLADGSSIFLKPGSAVRYPERFAADSRKVELRGEAFFEIAPDKFKPFYVYAAGALTQVLGTSFHMRAFGKEEEVTIGVRSGKVIVSRLEDNEPTVSVQVVPGQQAVVSRQAQGIETSLLRSDDAMGQFLISAANGENIEVVQYLRTAEKAFDMDISFDPQKMKTCKVRANFEGMHLVEQIDAICKAINARNTVKDGKIFIQAPGC